ncbi:MAG: NAD(P)-dependent oxidoreductase [Eubacteriales bacterium]|nr:NAD(P)-dependent oxidoreductase [Eubacteriales bacterium]
MEYPYFPLFVSLKGQKVLTAGAGAVAVRRVKALAEFGACVTVVAPACGAEFERLLDGCGSEGPGCIVWRRRLFQEADLDGMSLVLAATDDPELNSRIASLCRERNIPVNNSSRKEESDFYFPGIARDGELVIGVAASGQDHRLVRETVQKLKRWLLEGRN